MIPLSRRRFTIGVGAYLLAAPQLAGSAEELVASHGDSVSGDSAVLAESPASGRTDRWSRGENELWSWFERETLIDGRWQLSGITTPTNRQTGEFFEGDEGYLDDQLVPDRVRVAVVADRFLDQPAPDGPAMGQPSAERRSRDGRPPSEWLRSIQADELRDWLSQIDVPQAGVHGMTYWVHLTRDHSFRPLLIKGLTEAEQAKLHAAAHYGY
ncbi:MAG: hypothetical protein AAGA03_11070 [Planctomycetota bacterium]